MEDVEPKLDPKPGGKSKNTFEKKSSDSFYTFLGTPAKRQREPLCMLSKLLSYKFLHTSNGMKKQSHGIDLTILG
jgi:hypothetical protein